MVHRGTETGHATLALFSSVSLFVESTHPFGGADWVVRDARRLIPAKQFGKTALVEHGDFDLWKRWSIEAVLEAARQLDEKNRNVVLGR